MTKKEIILETVEYYKTHRRGITSHGTCVYGNEKNSKCAIGKVMNLESYNELKNYEGDVEDLLFNNDISDIDEILKDEYKNHELDFWMDLQHLHDGNSFWKKESKGSSLTAMGQEEVNKLLKIYADS